jgi:malonyl-CoA/methylmalonyl-CoA synthetase
MRSYSQLLDAAITLARGLGSSLPQARSRDGPRLGVYAAPGPHYVAATWATWLAGGIAVPLAVSHPPHELEYVMRDAGISAVRAHLRQQSCVHAVPESTRSTQLRCAHEECACRLCRLCDA